MVGGKDIHFKLRKNVKRNLHEIKICVGCFQSYLQVFASVHVTKCSTAQIMKLLLGYDKLQTTKCDHVSSENTDEKSTCAIK